MLDLPFPSLPPPSSLLPPPSSFLSSPIQGVRRRVRSMRMGRGREGKNGGSPCRCDLAVQISCLGLSLPLPCPEEPVLSCPVLSAAGSVTNCHACPRLSTPWRCDRGKGRLQPCEQVGMLGGKGDQEVDGWAVGRRPVVRGSWFAPGWHSRDGGRLSTEGWRWRMEDGGWGMGRGRMQNRETRTKADPAAPPPPRERRLGITAPYSTVQQPSSISQYVLQRVEEQQPSGQRGLNFTQPAFVPMREAEEAAETVGGPLIHARVLKDYDNDDVDDDVGVLPPPPTTTARHLLSLRTWPDLAWPVTTERGRFFL